MPPALIAALSRVVLAKAQVERLMLARAPLRVQARGACCPPGKQRSRARRLLEAIRTAAQRYRGRASAQIALPWLHARKPWIVPIPGTTKIQRLWKNMETSAIHLTNDDLRQIGDVLARTQVMGDRYPAKMMSR